MVGVWGVDVALMRNDCDELEGMEMSRAAVAVRGSGLRGDVDEVNVDTLHDDDDDDDERRNIPTRRIDGSDVSGC